MISVTKTERSARGMAQCERRRHFLVTQPLRDRCRDAAISVSKTGNPADGPNSSTKKERKEFVADARIPPVESRGESEN